MLLSNTVAAKERPILFSTSMVRAILEGRKTQTRRLIKLPIWSTGDWEDFETDGVIAETVCASTGCLAEIPCPHGKPGDILWVRETWENIDGEVLYKADGENCRIKWHPSIHMKRELSRIKLKLVEVGVEKIQDISDVDAIAEGIQDIQGAVAQHGELIPLWANYGLNEGNGLWFINPVKSFQSLWYSINGAASWDKNPYVWVEKFQVIEGDKR